MNQGVGGGDGQGQGQRLCGLRIRVGTVEAVYGHCRGTVEAVYGHCRGTVEAVYSHCLVLHVEAMYGHCLVRITCASAGAQGGHGMAMGAGTRVSIGAGNESPRGCEKK